VTAREKLNGLLTEIFLLNEGELSDELRRDDLATWDSLVTVSLGVGIEEVFGYHMSPEEAMGLDSVKDIVWLLRARGIEIE
jgi:acyl carrier protein